MTTCSFEPPGLLSFTIEIKMNAHSFFLYIIFCRENFAFAWVSFFSFNDFARWSMLLVHVNCVQIIIKGWIEPIKKKYVTCTLNLYKFTKVFVTKQDFDFILIICIMYPLASDHVFSF